MTILLEITIYSAVKRPRMFLQNDTVERVIDNINNVLQPHVRVLHDGLMDRRTCTVRPRLSNGSVVMYMIP